MDGPGIETRWERDFPHSFIPASGVHPASDTMGTGSLPGVKWPGRGVDHLPPSSAEVKESVELYLYMCNVLTFFQSVLMMIMTGVVFVLWHCFIKRANFYQPRIMKPVIEDHVQMQHRLTGAQKVISLTRTTWPLYAIQLAVCPSGYYTDTNVS
jgi:hypothetical protein